MLLMIEPTFFRIGVRIDIMHVKNLVRCLLLCTVNISIIISLFAVNQNPYDCCQARLPLYHDCKFNL